MQKPNLPAEPSCIMKRTRDTYNNLAPHYARTEYPPWDTFIRFLYSLPPNSLLLDIGCGSGRYANINPKIVSIGIDISLEQCKLAAGKGLSVSRCDCLKLPFKDESFDHVMSIHVIHHLPTEELRVQLLKEMCRVMRIGSTAGVSAHSTFNKDTNDDFVDWAGDTKGLDKTADLSRFYHYFGEGEFARLADQVDGLEFLEEGFQWEDGRIEAAFVRLW